MSKSVKIVAHTALAMLAAASLTRAASTNMDMSKDNTPAGQEKCYGVAMKGKNDCGAKHHACAGQAKRDRDNTDWVYVQEGTCNKLAGGKVGVMTAKPAAAAPAAPAHPMPTKGKTAENDVTDLDEEGDFDANS